MNKITKYTVLSINKDLCRAKLPVADNLFRVNYSIGFPHIFELFHKPTRIEDLKNSGLVLKHFHTFIINGVLRENQIYFYKNPLKHHLI
jgi:hypothetical protein